MIRIAVVPLRLVRQDEDTRWLAEALSEAISDSLSGIGRLVVRSAETLRLYARQGKDIAQIGEGLGADYVLQGTLARESVDGIRLTCHLAQRSTGEPVWSQVFELQWDRLHWLEEMMARRIAHTLRVELSPVEQRRLSRDSPKTLKSYEAYLRGIHASQESTPPRLREAIERYRQSIQLESYSSLPWARLGLCHRKLEWLGEDSEENAREAESAFDHALELSPESPLVHTLSIELAPECGRARTAMTALLRRAMRRPDDPGAWARLVKCCRYCGLLSESLDAERKARGIDTKSPTDVARTLFLAGDFELVARMHNGGSDTYLRAASHTALGHEDEALQLLRDQPEDEEVSPLRSLLRLSLFTLLQGGPRKALAVLHGSIPGYPLDPEGQLLLARHLSQFGDTDSALERSERALEMGFTHPRTLEDDPWLERLRSHRDFAELLERHREAESANRAAYREASGLRSFAAGAGGGGESGTSDAGSNASGQ